MKILPLDSRPALKPLSSIGAARYLKFEPSPPAGFPLTDPRSTIRALRGSASSSAQMPPSVIDGLEGSPGKSAPEAARSAAEKLVASALVLPALATLRDSPFLTDGPFAPGDAERRFGPLLDQYVADRLIHATSFPLIDSAVSRMTRNAKSAPPAGRPPAPPAAPIAAAPQETVDVRA